MKRLKFFSILAGFTAVLACAPVSDADPASETPVVEAQHQTSQLPAETANTYSLEAPELTPFDPAPKCSETAKQGGVIICHLPTGSRVFLDDKPVAIVDESGIATIGLKQNAKSPAIVSWEKNEQLTSKFEIPVATRQDDFRELPGMNCDKVDARTPEQKNHAAESWTKKVNAFANFNAPSTNSISFIKPANGPYTSPFGPTRHYTGVSEVTGKTCESTSVHQGLDMAVSVGTDLIAPMGGTIILADADLYYEGGAIFLDHGYGLVSVFMHLSEVSVSAGQIVETGERLGATGNTGRTTGPHLHWAVKWRNTAQSDRGGDFYVDPAIILDLPEWISRAE